MHVSFETDPGRYRHWEMRIDGRVATLSLRVDPDGGLRSDYSLKLNSYDLGVDIELHDAVQRLRFEHPEVGAVVLTGGLDKVFCAGANIQMLAGASHGHKVNFCKFTNETRSAIEDATESSGQVWLAAINGTAAGGGYELALACEEIVLVDDRSTAVSLPEIPLLAVLPGTGGLTRLVDKRHVRRDLADVFATRAEGVKGQQALDWGLVDTIAPRSAFDAVVDERARARASRSDRPVDAAGIALTPLARHASRDTVAYAHVSIAIDRACGAATITIAAPASPQPRTGDELASAGADAWIIAAARELDDALLHLRLNEAEIGTLVFRSSGDIAEVVRADEILDDGPGRGSLHWLTREARLLWTRTLKRVDLTARTLFAIVEPSSAFGGVLAELALAADRSFMLDGVREGSDEPEAQLWLTEASSGRHPMSNSLSRLATRFYANAAGSERAVATIGKPMLASEALHAGLVTFAPDDIDFDDDVRLALSERNSFSPDALTGMEANLRFVGPETMETKIFARLTAWQNWIFQRPNAVGPDGALKRYGSGSRAVFDRTRA